MRLSSFSDYSLRVLMYLAARPERLASIGEIAASHGISQNHLMKVALELGRGGFIETVRGKGGGLRLGRPAKEIVLGDVVRATESDFALAERFGSHPACRIQPACCLKGILREALNAMLLVLDGYTLEDLMTDPQGLVPAVELPIAIAQPQSSQCFKTS